MPHAEHGACATHGVRTPAASAANDTSPLHYRAAPPALRPPIGPAAADAAGRLGPGCRAGR
jgi:hypothetical protein